MDRIPINSSRGVKKGKKNKTLRGLTSNGTSQILELNGLNEVCKLGNGRIARFKEKKRNDLRKTIDFDVKSQKTKEKQVIQLSLFPNYLN